MLPFKETLHAKIHTYQTDTSGRFLHYKRILCFTRGLSAHGKLKIGASSGVVKELCFQELPMHSQEAAVQGGCGQARAASDVGISLGTSLLVLIIRVPFAGVTGG